MFTSMFAVVMTFACAAGPLKLGSDSARPSRANELSRDDVCHLVGLLIDQKGKRPGTEIVGSPCTQELTRTEGKVGIDVGIVDVGHPESVRPLKRGETCGRDDIVVACDSGDSQDACRSEKDPPLDHLLIVGFRQDDELLVSGDAQVLPMRPSKPGSHAVSRCGERRGLYKKVAGAWERQFLSE
jgi:hypothetical protein